jgi:ligand-binding sensor protein
VEQQELLPYGPRRPKALPLYDWLERDAIVEVIEEYSRHDPDVPRPCGFVCAETYSLLRTPVSDMSPYCMKLRRCEQGTKTCVLSDYVGSALAIERKEPLLYCCGGSAFDFTIPLRDRDGNVRGAFIDGQIRPRIAVTENIHRLSQEYELGADLLRDYKALPPLDHGRAHRTREYLCGEMADRLAFFNKRAKSPDLDIDAFRVDAKGLADLLDQAAGDGLAHQAWEVVGEATNLLERFAMIPLLHTSSSEQETSAGVRLDAAVRHPSYQQLRCHLSTYADVEHKSLEEACRHIGCEPQILAPGEGDRLRGFLDQVASKCYEPLDPKRRTMYWLATAVPDHDQIGVLAVAGADPASLEDQADDLKGTAEAVAAYLERYDLARMLTRVYGTPNGQCVTDHGRRAHSEAAQHRVSEWLSRSARPRPLAWKPLLEYLAVALDEMGDSPALVDDQRRDFDETVVAAVAGPCFSPLAEMRALRWLRSVTRTYHEARQRTGRAGGEGRYRPFRNITSEDERLDLIDEAVRWLEEHNSET